MTKKRVTASTSTHFSNKDNVDVPDSEFEIENHQSEMMLMDPEDSDGPVRTHSKDVPTFKGSKKVPTTAALHDEERTGPQDVHGLDMDTDPSAGYLETESGMPVVDVPLSADVDGEEDEDEDDEFSDLDSADDIQADLDEDDEFSDLSTVSDDDIQADLDEDDGMVDDATMDVDAPEPFEAEVCSNDEVPLVDADEVSDDVDSDDMQFATIANVVHAIRANRIVASMGAVTAKKVGVSDVYLTPQFQDVVAANINSKGLRKGLIQSGFVLAKVKLSASKTTAKVVQAKVEASLGKKIEAMAKKDKAMEQSLAIAAVGINRRYFKGVNNELKAALETELVRAGVRGGQSIVRAMFAQYGVSYAKSILTLANKLSAMPEEMRDNYAEALDMTEDEDFDEVDAEAEDDMGDVMEEDFDPIPASVTAALAMPVRREAALLTSGVKSTAALNILNGSQSLV